MALTEDEDSLFNEIMAKLLDGNMTKLSPREREFVQQQFDKYNDEGTDLFLSRKQWDWLKAIAERF